MADLVLHAPTSVVEACQFLAEAGGEARAIAGGTALVLMLRQGLLQPKALVRLDHIPGLDHISIDGGLLRIGALATLRSVAESAVVREQLPVLSGACGLVGNVRVRNVATLGGNVCEADYASDPPTVLVALDARVRIQGPRGAREIAVADCIEDFYTTALEPDEVLTDVLVPLPRPGMRAMYLKYVSRSWEDRPCVGAVALIDLAEDGHIENLRVAVGAIAGRPLRLTEVEAETRGERPTDDVFRSVAAAYEAVADPVEDVRGPAAYRKRMVGVFVRRALEAAMTQPAGARLV
ncbi:MAG: hypothetical protein HW416_2722 [Chloroflexi bacterium]|nr:hypothetical protein [Chloroflexota bacterium]